MNIEQSMKRGLYFIDIKTQKSCNRQLRVYNRFEIPILVKLDQTSENTELK